MLSSTIVEAKTLVHAGSLIDGISDKTRVEMTIVIEDGRFVEIQDGYADGTRGNEIIDLKDYTVMPGLMDMHTHLSGELTKKSYSEKFFMNDSDFALRSTVFARRTLMAGSQPFVHVL